MRCEQSHDVANVSFDTEDLQPGLAIHGSPGANFNQYSCAHRLGRMHVTLMDFQFPMNFRRALSAYFLFDLHEESIV